MDELLHSHFGSDILMAKWFGGRQPPKLFILHSLTSGEYPKPFRFGYINLKKHCRYITQYHEVAFHANVLHVSNSYLNKGVKGVVGVKAKQLIVEQLVMRFCHSLKFSDKTIKEMGYELAFLCLIISVISSRNISVMLSYHGERIGFSKILKDCRIFRNIAASICPYLCANKKWTELWTERNFYKHRA